MRTRKPAFAGIAVLALPLRTRFYWLIGWPLYWARALIGMGPYGWAHVRWLRAWCAEVGLRGSILAFVVALPLALGGCPAFTENAGKFETALNLACREAISIANLVTTGFIPGANEIVPFIRAGCATAEGLAKLAADPTSAQWVGDQIGKIKVLAANVGVWL